MRELKMKVTLLNEDGSEISSMVLSDWSLEREMAEFQSGGMFERYPTGEVVIRGVDRNGDQS